jgi:hypothetical protein
MSARNLKIRSLENGIYDKNRLTRIRFEVQPDLMTSDMGNSYLALRTTLYNGLTKTPIDTKQIAGQTLRFFALGDGQTAYDPTCLFRTAKLFNKATGQVIEELNYNNVRTNTFKEYTLDFESLASDTIESGLGIPDAKLDNLQSTYTLWTGNNPAELHIPLKTLFPSLNTPFFQLGAVGGLVVDLELDVTHPLVMEYTNPTLVIPPPTTTANDIIGFTTDEQEDYSWLVSAQLTSEFGAIAKHDAVQRPEYWEFPRSTEATPIDPKYWDTILGADVYPPYVDGVSVGTDVYKWYGARQKYQDADIQDLTLFPVSVSALYKAEVRGAFLDVEGEEIGTWAFDDSIIGQDASGQLQFSNTHVPVKRETLGVFDLRFDGIYSPVQVDRTFGISDPQSLNYEIDSETTYTVLQLTNSFGITADYEQLLIKAGLLKSVGGIITKVDGVDFKVYLQMLDTTQTEVYIAPDWELEEFAGGRAIFTNLKHAYPRSAPETRNSIAIYDSVLKRITLEESLELTEDVGTSRPKLYFRVLWNDGEDGKQLRLPTGLRVSFQDVNKADDPFVQLTGHYPSTDLAEMVVVQYPPVKAGMPKFYRTMSVEPFVINSGFPQIVQNFMLEPNVYNAWILIPLPSTSTDPLIPNYNTPSLICGNGNVKNFRFTIDEVDVTSRDIAMLNSTFGDFPDSLYWDKLIDCFSNSAMSLKSLNGIVTGVNQRPTRVLPVRIYGGLVNGVVNFSNTMKRLQVRMDAPQNQSVQAGTAFLFKEKYKSWSA